MEEQSTPTPNNPTPTPQEPKRSRTQRMAKWTASIIHFFATIPYRRIASKIFSFIGNVMHWLTFRLLLPKKWRNLSKHDIYTIIFKSDTPAGKKFDIWLLILIGLNILVMILDSYEGVSGWFSKVLRVIEWLFTLFFTFEYYLRIYCLKQPKKYVFSFYGIIDFLSIFPAYLGLFFPTAQALSVLRILRALRIFRILKMQKFIDTGLELITAIRNSLYMIIIFMMIVFMVAVILGSVVYSLESSVEDTAFTSIPKGIYWAVVTLTTVGYGDITPQTSAGQVISVIIMLLGYSVIAVPTGIVVGETMVVKTKKHNEQRLTNRNNHEQHPFGGSDVHSDDDSDDESEVLSSIDTPQPKKKSDESPSDSMEMSEEPIPNTLYCKHCGYEESDPSALYCSRCGTRLSNDDTHSWVRDFFRS